MRWCVPRALRSSATFRQADGRRRREHQQGLFIGVNRSALLPRCCSRSYPRLQQELRFVPERTHATARRRPPPLDYTNTTAASWVALHHLHVRRMRFFVGVRGSSTYAAVARGPHQACQSAVTAPPAPRPIPRCAATALHLVNQLERGQRKLTETREPPASRRVSSYRRHSTILRHGVALNIFAAVCASPPNTRWLRRSYRR